MVQQGGTKYSYDADGYLTSGSHVIDSRYSAQGELLSATTTAGQSIAYSYDGMARRVARHDQSGTSQYFYTNPDQPFQLSAARDPDGTFTAYYYDPYGSLFAFKRGTSTYYVGSDHLGTPRVIADSDGTVVDIMEYDSYGSLLSDSNPTFKLPIGFAGGIVDITGLIRFGFRDYEPASGRWASRDPILYRGGQANVYQYLHNDPISMTDPHGLGPHDKFYGLPPEFWHWYHRNRKEPGDPDLTKKEAEDFNQEWEKLGKPRPDHKGKNRTCKIDETAYTSLPDGMGTLIPLFLPSMGNPTSAAPIRVIIPRFAWY